MLRPLVLLVAGVAIIAFGLASVGPGPQYADAHGAVDQTLTGDPACGQANFPNGVASFAPMLQEFVPATADLVAVDLCMASGPLVVPFTINIRSGTAASPGAIIATGSGVTGGGPLAFVHVDLSGSLATTPAAMLVIEIPIPANEVDWYGTVPTGPDLYPSGTSSTDFVGDFAFRTYSSNTPTPTGPSTNTPTTNTAGAGTATLTSQPAHTATRTATPTQTMTATASTPSAASSTHTPVPPTSADGGAGAGVVAPPDTGYGASTGRSDSAIALVMLACGMSLVSAGLIIAARRSSMP
jgi:hypothetical protein